MAKTFKVRTGKKKPVTKKLVSPNDNDTTFDTKNNKVKLMGAIK